MHTRNRFYYGWIIVAVGLLVCTLAYGFRYSFSVMFTSLLAQLHASRSATAGMLSLHLLVYGATAPLAGFLIDRFGAKRTMGVGFFILILGIIIAGFSNSLPQYYLSYGLLMGIGLALSGTVPFIRVISQWFESGRGAALSIMMTGAGLSHLLYPAIAYLIGSIGLRFTYLVEAGVVAFILLPCVLLFVRGYTGSRSNPVELNADVPQKSEPDAALSGSEVRQVVEWTLPRALRAPRFWFLCFTSFAAWGITQHTMIAHHVAFAEDVGFSKVYASSILSLFGLMVAAGTLTGLVSDRIGREATFTIGAVPGIAGLIMIMLIQDASRPWMLYAYALFFGFGIGLTIPALTAATVDIFTGKRAGLVIGFVWFAYALGGAIGPWLGGVIFQTTGNYRLAFILAIIFLVLSCMSLWLAAPRLSRRGVPR